jgi:hypothetical protein
MRFFFNIQDRLQIEDEVGREFSLASEAVAFAKHLAADIRCLETAVRPRSRSKWSPRPPNAFIASRFLPEQSGVRGASAAAIKAA